MVARSGAVRRAAAHGRWRRFVGDVASCMIGAVMLASAAGARAVAWSLRAGPCAQRSGQRALGCVMRIFAGLYRGRV